MLLGTNSPLRIRKVYTHPQSFTKCEPEPKYRSKLRHSLPLKQVLLFSDSCAIPKSVEICLRLEKYSYTSRTIAHAFFMAKTTHEAGFGCRDGTPTGRLRTGDECASCHTQLLEFLVHIVEVARRSSLDFYKEREYFYR